MFEEYRQELQQSDRDPKSIARYWKCIETYHKWLGDDQMPDVANVKAFLSHLRDKGYKPKSVILYYHAIRQFFDFIGMPLKVKLRKPKVIPHYTPKADFEALAKAAELV